MDVRTAMFRLGGVTDTASLRKLVTRRQINRALRDGKIVRTTRGRYALPFMDVFVRAAQSLNGVVSHLSAAQLHGWEVKTVPQTPAVTVPRNRKVSLERREGIDVTWSDLRDDEVVDGVTSRERTFIDCAKTLPFDEALAVADSALRHGMAKGQLIALAESVRGAGRDKCLRVARAADGRAANPFESALRAIAMDVRGLTLVPQVEIVDDDFYARPDLVDEKRRVVIEADSFEWHGKRKALMRDCRRYTGLTVRGWTVLRFSWEDVMLHPDYVLDCLVALVDRPKPRRRARRAA